MPSMSCSTSTCPSVSGPAPMPMVGMLKDAVILAAAGLNRIGRADVISEYLDFLPAPAQGALAVQAAVDGEEAVRLFEAHRDEISLVILDVVMPGRGGREAGST